MSREVAALDHCLPLLKGQGPSLTALANQQEVLDIHVLHALLLLACPAALSLVVEYDEILTSLFHDVLDDEFEAAGTQFGRERMFRVGLLLRVCFFVFEVGLELLK